MSAQRQTSLKYPLTGLQRDHMVEFMQLLECFELLLAQFAAKDAHHRIRLEQLCAQTVEDHRIQQVHAVAKRLEEKLQCLRLSHRDRTDEYIDHIQGVAQQLQAEGIPGYYIRRAVQSLGFSQQLSKQLMRRPQMALAS